jgi:hypothetical protein
MFDFDTAPFHIVPPRCPFVPRVWEFFGSLHDIGCCQAELCHVPMPWLLNKAGQAKEAIELLLQHE